MGRLPVTALLPDVRFVSAAPGANVDAPQLSNALVAEALGGERGEECEECGEREERGKEAECDGHRCEERGEREGR